MKSLEYLDRAGTSEIISYFKSKIHTLEENLQGQIDSLLVEGVPQIEMYQIDALFIKENQIYTYDGVVFQKGGFDETDV